MSSVPPVRPPVGAHAVTQHLQHHSRAALMRVRSALISLREMLITGGPVLLLAVGLVWMAYVVLNPNPPRRMTLATGTEQGAYHEFGKRYQTALAKHGIEVVLKPTQGSQENLQLLQQGEVDAAFVQGGSGEVQSGDITPPEDLLSLGSLFREPVWVFYRTDTAYTKLGRDTLDSLSQLAGWKLNVGQDGSGVTNLMRRLLEANGLDMGTLPLSRLSTTPAVMALLNGEIDAMAMVSAPESPIVRMLLITPGVRLLDFTQAEAYARRVPQVSPVTLPRGVVDLAQDLPHEDIHLVASMATLVVREETHPALQQLLVQAAHRIHGQANWFQHKGEFPKAQGGEYTLSAEAQRFYASGEPMLQRHVQFWLANLVDRMWVALLSIVAVLIPLSRIVPPLYNFRIRSRIFRWYGTLREIEQSVTDRSRPVEALQRELNDLDERVERLPVPLSYALELYALRSHIDLVRQRLQNPAVHPSITEPTDSTHPSP